MRPARAQGRSGDAAYRSVLLLSDDPYLAFLLERHPRGLEVTVADRQMRVASVVSAHADLVVCEHDDPRLADLYRELGARLITVAPPDTSALTTRVIRRPLSSDDVQRAVDAPLALRTRWLDDPIGSLAARYPWGLLASALVAAAAVALGGGSRPLLVSVAAAVVYAALRVRRPDPRLLAGDVVLATAAALLNGGIRGVFVVLSLVVASGLGLHASRWLVFGGSLLIGASNAIGGAWVSPEGTDPATAAQTVLIPLLVALVAALGSERQRSGPPATHDRLTDLLAELRALANVEPAALRVPDAARTSLDDVLRAAGATAGALLVPTGSGTMEVAATRGIDDDPDRPALRLPARILSQQLGRLEPPELPDPWSDVLGGAAMTVPLTDDGVVHGVVLARGTRPGRPARKLRAAAALSGVRLANARSFARLQTDTVDAERRRLAGELHDSTAQVLAHVRLELQLLAREGGAGADELGRLARVTGRAQHDLREVINGLRAAVEDEGLAGSLRAYVADLRSRTAPALRFSGRTTHAFAPEVEREVFRIAQEAISNAVRHAAATTVNVHLDSDQNGIALTVDDDGRGMPVGTSSRGLGMNQMSTRADRIGGELEVVSNDAGTAVRLHVPADRAAASTRRPVNERGVRA